MRAWFGLPQPNWLLIKYSTSHKVWSPRPKRWQRQRYPLIHRAEHECNIFLKVSDTLETRLWGILSVTCSQMFSRAVHMIPSLWLLRFLWKKKESELGFDQLKGPGQVNED